MIKGVIGINLYKFNELSERVQGQIRRKMGYCFKEWVKEDTLFLRNGVNFDMGSLYFMGLPKDDYNIKVKGRFEE